MTLDGSSANGFGYGNNEHGSYANIENGPLADGTSNHVSPNGRWIRWDDLEEKSMEYLSKIVKGELCVGVPVYFFFNLASTSLTDKSQLVNLDAIVNCQDCGILKLG